jgi:hypothetical protein
MNVGPLIIWSRPPGTAAHERCGLAAKPVLDRTQQIWVHKAVRALLRRLSPVAHGHLADRIVNFVVSCILAWLPTLHLRAPAKLLTVAEG